MRGIGLRGALLLTSLGGLLYPSSAGATGFTELGQDITPRTETAVKVEGYFRARGEGLYNLDLDRGLTPSGKPLFPVPLANGASQTLLGGDMRLRTDISLYAPGGTLAVKVRLDTLDNVAFGSSTEGSYAAAQSQQSPASPIRVKRAYGMAVTPFGVLSAGRMGNGWGLGMLANGGDCADCDGGDAADRIAFVTPLGGLIWAASYDISATGPVQTRKDGSRILDIEPTDNVHTLTFALLRYKDDSSRERRRRGEVGTVEYGTYVSHRWQNNDVPAGYLDAAQPTPLTAAQVIHRGYSATAIDGWLRLTWPSFRVELETAYITARVDQSTLLPGALLKAPVTSSQLGAALESEFGAPESAVGAGFDAGYASGDPAPGMGAFPGSSTKAPAAGDLDGAQANPPRDNKVDNFRFSPDYRIDRILFREIIGTVTDAVYLRPHARIRVWKATAGELQLGLAAIASWAVYASSTPGGSHALGVELDPTISYRSRDGFGLSLEHGVLVPGAGLDNPSAHLQAKSAQVLRLRLFFGF